MGGSTVRNSICSAAADYILTYVTDNEFVQLMMQK